MINRHYFETVRIRSYNRTAQGLATPRWIRKLFAGTIIHRAWLQGSTGSFLVPVLERN